MEFYNIAGYLMRDHAIPLANVEWAGNTCENLSSSTRFVRQLIKHFVYGIEQQLMPRKGLVPSESGKDCLRLSLLTKPTQPRCGHGPSSIFESRSSRNCIGRLRRERGKSRSRICNIGASVGSSLFSSSLFIPITLHLAVHLHLYSVIIIYYIIKASYH